MGPGAPGRAGAGWRHWYAQLRVAGSTAGRRRSSCSRAMASHNATLGRHTERCSPRAMRGVGPRGAGKDGAGGRGGRSGTPGSLILENIQNSLYFSPEKRFARVFF